MRRRPDFDEALWLIQFIRERQPDGKFLLRALKGKRPVSRLFLDNRDPDFDAVARQWLKQWADGSHHIFYAVNAFTEERATAEFVKSSRLAHVDADNVRVPPPGPAPTLIVNTSPGNHQFIYELDAEVSGEEIEAINRKLTGIVGGDTGHSRAKLLRLPGTYNVKPEYDPKPLVAILQKDGPVHRAAGLLRDTIRPAIDKTPFERVEKDAQALSPDEIIGRYRRNLPRDVRLRLGQREPRDAWSIRINGKRYAAERDNRSAIVFQIGKAFREAGATPAEVLAVMMSTCFWQAREAGGKREDPKRLISKIFMEDVAKPLAVDPADWADKPVPERVWLLDGWIPAGKVTGLYGDGATGKTTLALQLAVSVALRIEFLGMPVKQGRVYALLAENDPDDSHIALHEICEHHEVTLAELRDRVRIASRAGLDNVLMSFEGRPQTTTLFKQLLTEVKAFGPVLVILETAADLFGGNENDRGQVRSFLANCCSSIAIETGAAVLLCAHPSVAGLKSGEGSGGSTAWNNTLRSRLWLHRDLNDHNEEVDADVRILELKKANFGARGQILRLRWTAGAFAPDDLARPLASALHQASEAGQAVAERYAAGEPFSAHPQSGHRWLGHWVMKKFSKNRRAARVLVQEWIAGGFIKEIFEAHQHRRVLCTPEQAKNARAKEAR